MASELKKTNDEIKIPQYKNMISGYQGALQIVDDVILKNYVTNLSALEVVPLDDDTRKTNLKDNVLFFKINEMVYEKDEFALYKFASVFNSLAMTQSAIFIMIDSNGIKTDFYMGVRSLDEERTVSSLKKILKNAMAGQFPGIVTADDYTIDDIQYIVEKIKGNSISSVSCVANSKEEHLKDNEEFVQGLEKLIFSMQGQKYTGIIIANTTSQTQLRELRKGYESIYTQLSPFAAMQINYGQNSAESENKSEADGTSDTNTETISRSHTVGKTQTNAVSHTQGTSQENTTSKVIKGLASASSLLGAALAPVTGGASLALGGVVSGGLSLLGMAVSGTESNSASNTASYTDSESDSSGESNAVSHGTTHTYTYGTSVTKGLSNAITLTAHDKSIEDMLLRIDRQLERMDEFESLGMYECAAYFLSEDQATSEMAASTYKAIIGGENTGVEIAAINSWGSYQKNNTMLVEQYLKNFIHPVFKYNGILGSIEVTPTSMVSGNELAIHMGLPRKSVCGLPVIEHADFGKEIVNYNREKANTGIKLGKIFNMGSAGLNDVYLDKNSLSMHTFVAGATGSGKSNTVYEMLRQCNNMGINFMVIEPAKGEYKHVFGSNKDVRVLGTNPAYADLLRINPFKFPEGIHVLEHVDRLVEIFNVCWPMYAAMPAVLKDAVLQAYEVCGWNLFTSENKYDKELFPTFLDLLAELTEVIEGSAYDTEVKSNYKGSLETRIRSLTNGLNGQIFASKEIDNKVLFDSKVIVDLSRIGSLETKSLIMGILVMRLNEYRMTNTEGMNIPMRHVTVLEEAHNILKKSSAEQNIEGANMAGKSVEMISNAIAEMRTYGEGFIIVDQSPNAVDISAIRNTNTKIIMRLPEEADRRLAGKSAALKDEQLDELAKLPKGVAVVYQNDWLEPVLCKVSRFSGEEKKFTYQKEKGMDHTDTEDYEKEILKLLLKGRMNKHLEIDIDKIRDGLVTLELSTKNRIMVYTVLNEYENKRELQIWKDRNFGVLSKLVTDLLDCRIQVEAAVKNSEDFDELGQKIIQIIQSRFEEDSKEMQITLGQCLMKDYSADVPEKIKLYAAWKEHVRHSGNLYNVC